MHGQYNRKSGVTDAEFTGSFRLPTGLLAGVAGPRNANVERKEIAVMAERRAQSLQGAPVAVTAFSEAAIETQQIQDFGVLP